MRLVHGTERKEREMPHIESSIKCGEQEGHVPHEQFLMRVESYNLILCNAHHQQQNDER